MTTQICTTPTDRFVHRRVAGPLRISQPAEFFFQHLNGISPRRLTDGHRSTSKSGQIATHPPTDRWQDSSSTVVRAPRRTCSPSIASFCGPAERLPPAAASISQRSTWIRTTMNRVNLAVLTMCAATSQLPGQPRATSPQRPSQDLTQLF